MKRAALYVRVSTEDQKIHGLSIEDQTEKLNAWAQKEHVIIVGYYNDAGISARKPASKRPELQRLLNDVRAGKIDIIVFTKLDRWFRNISEYYKVQEVLETHHVDWKTIYEDYDTSTASGRLKINIMLSVAQDEADRTGERIKAIHESKVERKEPISGKVPLGYKIENKHMVIDEEKAKIALDIFKQYIAIRSIGALRKYIFEAYGILYYHTTIRHLLQNKRYIGFAHDQENFCPAIIPKDMFEKTQEILSIRAQRTDHSRTNRVYLFSGIVFCAECGNRLAAHAVDKYIYYRCTKYEKVHLCSHKKRTSELVLEKWLLSNLPAKLIEYNLNIEAREKATQPKIDTAKIQRKMEKLKDLYLNDLIELDIYENEYTSLKKELAKATMALAPVQKPIDVDAISESLSLYPKLSDEGKKEFWSRILKKIIITQDDDFFIEPYSP